MKRVVVLSSLLSLGLAFALLSLNTSRLAAQEASPMAGEAAVTPIELAPGVIAEVFAAAPSARAAGQTVYLARFTFAPGSEIFPHSHPGTIVIGVDSGSLGWTLQQGTAHLVRGSGTGATETEEITEPGTEVILEAGDALFYEDDVVHTARGAGDEPTVVLGTLVLETGQPLIMPVDMEMGAEATPAP